MLSVLVCSTRRRAGRERFGQHVNRAEIVHAVELASRPRPKLRVRREMIDDTAPLHRAAYRGAVADVGRGNVDLVERKVIELRAGPIHDPHPFAALDQKPDEVRPDEPRTTGDDTRKGHSVCTTRLVSREPEASA